MLSKILSMMLLLSGSFAFAQFSQENPNYYSKKYLKAEVEMLEEVEYYASNNGKKKESFKKFSKSPKTSTVYYFDKNKRIVQIQFRDGDLKVQSMDKFEYSADGKTVSIKGYGSSEAEYNYLKMLYFDQKDRLIDFIHFVRYGEGDEMLKLSRSQYDYDDKNKSFVHTETEWTGDDSLVVTKMGTLNANGLEESYVIQYDKEADYKEVKYNRYNENNDLIESVFIAYEKNAESGNVDTTQTLLRQYKYDDKGRQTNQYVKVGEVQDDITVAYDSNGFINAVKVINIKAEKLKESNFKVEYKLDSKYNFTEMKSLQGKDVEKIIKRKIKYFN